MPIFLEAVSKPFSLIGEKDKSRALWKKALERLALENNNYYSYVLCLLSKIDLKP